ncbi:MAG: type II toxin-antitoxin system VapB family antitoxin [Deltaproteobacteria bacterium]|nr:type II toxin-antitoxin system VapB family antitoxin [Deltaproteobacteria bacterium]
MRTSMVISQDLLDEACRVGGLRTKTQAVITALTEYIQRRKSRRILALRGSLKRGFDYKPLRRKR